MKGVGPGTVLGGRYTMQRRVAQDRDTERWTADDTTLGRQVSVLVASSEDHRSAAFVDAARRAASVSHAVLVRILDVGQDEDVAYVVEEVLDDATTLGRLVTEGGIPGDEVRRITGEVAAALESARRRGMHHLDLTPDDVLRTTDGEVRLRGLEVAGVRAGEDGLDPDEAARRDAVGVVALAYAGLTGLWPLGAGGSGLGPAPRVPSGVASPSEIAAGVPRDIDAICRLTLNDDQGPTSPGDYARQVAPWPSRQVVGKPVVPAIRRDEPHTPPTVESVGPGVPPRTGEPLGAGREREASAPSSRAATAGAPGAAAGAAAGAASGAAAASPTGSPTPATPAAAPTPTTPTPAAPTPAASDAGRTETLPAVGSDAATTAPRDDEADAATAVHTWSRDELATGGAATTSTFPARLPEDDEADETPGTDVANQAPARPEAPAWMRDGGENPFAAPRTVDVDGAAAAGSDGPGPNGAAPGPASPAGTEDGVGAGIGAGLAGAAAGAGAAASRAASRASAWFSARTDSLRSSDTGTAHRDAADPEEGSPQAGWDSDGRQDHGWDDGWAASRWSDRPTDDDRGGSFGSPREDDEGSDRGALVGSALAGGTLGAVSTRVSGLARRAVDKVSDLSPDSQREPAGDFDDDAPAAMVPAEPLSHDESKLALGIVVAFLVFALVIGIIGVKQIGSNTDLGLEGGLGSSASPSPSASPSASASSSSGDDKTKAPEPLAILKVSAYDPLGDGAENDYLTPKTYDGDTSTGWFSETYLTDDFGGLKKGVGLIVDLGPNKKPQTVSLDIPKPSDFELYVNTDPSLEGAKKIGEKTDADGTLDFTVPKKVDGQYIIVWYTGLHVDSEGKRRAWLNEVVVSG